MTTNGNIQVKEIFPVEQESNQVFGTVSILNYLAGAGESIPPWWSFARDIALRNFVKNSDHLSGTVNTLRDMLVAIPFQVLPRDAGVKSHVRQADRFTEMMLDKSESHSSLSSFGWGAMYGPAVEDYHSTDNGLIIAIDGEGESDGPVIGMPTRLIHLDSSRCLRTNSREFPIVYTDYNGKRYKLHYTRVISMASMSSPIAEMHGVGFCATSRCINVVQNLMDISRYKQEKLGSRPTRAILHIAGGGQREVAALDALLKKYGYMQDNQGFTRYGKIPIYGSTGTLNLIDFASLPDGFNELESTQLGMAVLALAFGVDSRQLAFALGVSGQTKADAQIQHLKMMGKGPGLFIREFERQINAKVLPAHLMMVFDYQDDEQDAAKAGINKVRADTRKINLETKVTTVSIEREQMVEDGELTRQQFERLEVEQEENEVIQNEMMQDENGMIQSENEMIQPETIQDELTNEVKSLSTFTASVRATARGLYYEHIDLIDFINSLNSAIERGYEQAWQEGQASCGIAIEERTAEEWAALHGKIAIAKTHVFEFGEFIEENREQPFSSIEYRIAIWANRYSEVVNQAKVMACQNQKLVWVLGGTKEHCKTCLRLNGRVMRASRWKELDVHPQDTRPGRLDCNGYNCGCSLVATTGKATPGRLPKLRK